MYLQHRGPQQSTDRARNILFYALCVLYALAMAISIIDILIFCRVYTVSLDHHRCCLTLLQLVLQNMYYVEITEVTIFAFCDAIAQSILVCTTGNAYHSSNSSKDISLLDRLGSQHSCCNRSVTLSIRILTSINLSSFIV